MKLALFALTLFAASHANAAEFTVEKITIPGYPKAEWHIATDTETGCQYIVTGTTTIPRMGSDQRQICKPTETKK